MSALTYAEYERDESLQALLLRHREAALREALEENAPKLLRVVDAVRPAAEKVIEDQTK